MKGLDSFYDDNQPLHEKDRLIKNLERKLGKSSKVIIPTYKTNSFRVIELDQYKTWVKENLSKSAVLSSRERKLASSKTLKIYYYE